MERGNAFDRSALPRPLLRPTPRHVRPNVWGALAIAGAVVLVIAGFWGGIDLHRKARDSERRVRLFATESVATDADVMRVQRRGGGNDRRSVVHYRYVGGDKERTGTATLRRSERDRYTAGSRASVRYLASEPDSSWIEGQSPRRRQAWPAFATPLACVAAAVALVAVIRRQSRLLAYGRPAIGTVTAVEKKRTDKGSYWRVRYQWSVPSGAKREGRYHYSRKNPPAIGTPVTIVYDGDTEKSARYPLPLVTISDE